MNNSDKKMAKTQSKKIQLHYFPDIPVAMPAQKPECVPENNTFKRIHFDANAPACSDTAKTAAESDAARPLSSSDEIEKQAYESGFQEGQKSALESQIAEVESAVKSLNQAVADIQNLRQEIYHTIEHEVVELALSIARKVVCQEIKTSKDVVVCVAQEALSQVEVPGKIKIRMNPADLEFISETREHISGLLHQIDNVSFEAAEGIAAGGCVIETKLGEIDARIEKQIQIVEDKFRSEFAQSQPETNPDENS